MSAAHPDPQEHTWIARDFRFHDGTVLPELRIGYTTVGDPAGEPVLVLHGTTGSARSLLTPAFAGRLFGPGQPLDASRYFLVLPDAIGHGRSSKPSDGLRMGFPRYGYDDMVAAQHRLLAEHLGIGRLRLVIGHSMGGMHAWLWGVRHPELMDVLVPMACQPAPVAGRNWMLRRLLIESITRDPEWNGGWYVEQPRGYQLASTLYSVATNGGTRALHRAAPTREQADRLVEERLQAPFTGDTNDALYQWSASADYDPSPDLERIRATVLAVNAADDERNPPETGVMERTLQRVRNARYLLVPGSDETVGHGTTGHARWYAAELAELLRTAPRL